MVNETSSPPKSSCLKAGGKVFPQKIDGTFRRLKWLVMIMTPWGLLHLYLGSGGIAGPNAPDQAVLLDLEAKRFYFFFIELWPNEIYFRNRSDDCRCNFIVS